MNAMDLSGFSGAAIQDNKQDTRLLKGKSSIVQGNMDIVYQDSAHYNNSIEPSIEMSNGLYTSLPNAGLRINKIASQNAKKQSIQRIYDNKNIYKQFGGRQLSNKRQPSGRINNLVSSASNREFMTVATSNQANEVNLNAKLRPASKSTQRGGGRKSVGNGLAPQLNTIQGAPRQAQSHTRGGQRMATMRPGYVAGKNQQKPPGMIKTIYESGPQASFINSYGQISMRSLSIRDQNQIKGMESQGTSFPSSKNNNTNYPRSNLRGKSNKRSQRVHGGNPLPIPNRQNVYQPHKTNRNQDTSPQNSTESQRRYQQELIQSIPQPIKATTNLTSKKKLRSIAYMDGNQNQKYAPMVSESQQNLVVSVTTIQGILSDDAKDTKITETQINPTDKNPNLSLLEVSRLTQFSQVSPQKTSQKINDADIYSTQFQANLGDTRGKKNLEQEQLKDKQHLESIQKEYAKVNIRIQQRANLLNTIQSEHEMSAPSQQNIREQIGPLQKSTGLIYNPTMQSHIMNDKIKDQRNSQGYPLLPQPITHVRKSNKTLQQATKRGTTAAKEKSISPDPSRKFHNDIQRVAQLYRGNMAPKSSAQKYFYNQNDSMTIVADEKELINQIQKNIASSQSRERKTQVHKSSKIVPSVAKAEDVYARKRTVDPRIKANARQNLNGMNTIAVSQNYNSSSISQNMIASRNKRLAQGSRPRASQIKGRGQQIAGASSQVTGLEGINGLYDINNSINTIDKKSLNTVSMQSKRGQSKSTLRNNTRSINQYAQYAQNSQQSGRVFNVQSVGRERPQDFSKKNSNLNKIQLKKSMLQATYQSQNQQRVLQTNENVVNSLNDSQNQLRDNRSISALSAHSGMKTINNGTMETIQSKFKYTYEGHPLKEQRGLNESQRAKVQSSSIERQVRNHTQHSTIVQQEKRNREQTQSPVLPNRDSAKNFNNHKTIQHNSMNRRVTTNTNTLSQTNRQNTSKSKLKKHVPQTKNELTKVQQVNPSKFYQSANRAVSVPPVMKNQGQKIIQNQNISIKTGRRESQSRGRNKSSKRGAQAPSYEVGHSSRGKKFVSVKPNIQQQSMPLSEINNSGVNMGKIESISAEDTKNAYQQVQYSTQSPLNNFNGRLFNQNNPGIISNQYSFKSGSKIDQNEQNSKMSQNNNLVQIEFKKEQDKYDIKMNASRVEYNTTISPNSQAHHAAVNNTAIQYQQYENSKLTQEHLQNKQQHFQSCDQQYLLNVIQDHANNNISQVEMAGHNRYGISLEKSDDNNNQLATIKVSQVLEQLNKQNADTPFELDLNYETNFDQTGEDEDGHQKKMQGQNKLNKILISQIIENSKSNFMSINDTLLQYKRQQEFNNNLENFKTGDLQVMRAHNETINSSNLVMNNRDRANVQDFLSAQTSGAGNIKRQIDIEENDVLMNKRDSQDFISDMFATGGPINNETINQKKKVRKNDNVSNLKNTSANPLLNDSMNRSFQSGQLQSINQNKVRISGSDVRKSDQVGANKEKLNQRYQLDEENDQDQAIQEEDHESYNPSSQKQSSYALDKPSATFGNEELDEDDDQEIVDEINISDHDQTKTNILVSQNENDMGLVLNKRKIDIGGGPQPKKASEDKQNKMVRQKFIPFNADDEDEEIPQDIPDTSLSPGKKAAQGSDGKQENLQFYNGRNITDQVLTNEYENSSPDRKVGQDQNDAKILSLNSTAIGKGLNNSKTTVDTLNTFSQNPNRKSAFLFGSRQGQMISQNNLRYSQQNTGGSLQKLQMKSVALNQMYKLNNAQVQPNKKLPELPKPKVDPGKSQVKNEAGNPEKNIINGNSNMISQAQNTKITNKIEKIGEESEKVSSDPDKINDKITEQYADEEQDNTSQSNSRSVLAASSGRSKHTKSEFIIKKKVEKTKIEQKIELIKSQNSSAILQNSFNSNKITSKNQKDKNSPQQEQERNIDEESMDNIMLESVQSIKQKPINKDNQYTKQFENNFIDSHDQALGGSPRQMSVMTGSRGAQSPANQSEENFKRNLIMSQDSANLVDNKSIMSNQLEDSHGIIIQDQKDNLLESSQEFVNRTKGDNSFYDGHMIGRVEGINRNDSFAVGNTGPQKLPRLRFGRVETDGSNSHEGLTQSKRSHAPENSDDDVCSRRGLEGMTDSQLLALEQLANEGQGYIQNQDIELSAKQLEAPSTEKLKPVKAQEVLLDALSNDDANDNIMEASIIVKSQAFLQPNQEKNKAEEEKLAQSDASSVCNILDSSRTHEENKDSNARRQRYGYDSGDDEELEESGGGSQPIKTNRQIDSIENLNQMVNLNNH